MSPCLPLRSLAYGGDERVRTAGLLLARQALYQLSYTPTLLRFGAWLLLPLCFSLLKVHFSVPSKPYSKLELRLTLHFFRLLLL